jgi:hypothetical protein
MPKRSSNPLRDPPNLSGYMQIRIDPEGKAAIERLARARGISGAALLRSLAADAYDRYLRKSELAAEPPEAAPERMGHSADGLS